MKLLVDLGNSCLKWALSDGARWQLGRRPHSGTRLREMLDHVWGGLAAPERIVACNVAGADAWQALEQWCVARWSHRPQRVQAQAQFGRVRNGYRQPAELGADRWVALIAARELAAANLCVVDCGTAVTVDMLSASGEHLGGVIFPGLHMLRGALAAGTDGIHARPGNASSCLALSTADGVAAGTAFGLAGAIDRILAECQQILSDTNAAVFMTGGDAELVMGWMTRPVRHVPDLVLRGLKQVADSL